MEQKKVDRISNFSNTLSLKKAEELKSKHLSGTLIKKDFDRLIIFKDLPIEEQEKKELVIDNYISIESRLAVLNKADFFDESIMIAMLFLQDNSDENALYDSNLKIEKDSFRRILYFLCMALHQTKQFTLCQPHIDLLQKLVIVFPSENNPPQDLMDRIGYQVYHNL